MKLRQFIRVNLRFAAFLPAMIMVSVMLLHAYPGLAQNTSSQKTVAKKAVNAALVGVDKVQSEIVSQTFPVIGRLVARQSGVVAARVAGPVAEMRAAVGDRMKKGDVLAVLVREQLHWVHERRAAEVTSRKAQLAGREAELTMRHQEMERLEKLRKNKSAAHRESKFDDMRQQVAILNSQVAEAAGRLLQAEADAHLAQIDLRYTTVTAPFSGVVTQRHTDVGAYLNVGQPVVTMIDDSALEVEAEVPADRLAGLLAGAEVTVGINDQTFTAKVRAVVPQENPLTRTRAVRFSADMAALLGRLAGNQSVTVAIPVNAGQKVISVHKDAILKRRGNDMVFLIENGVAQPRNISIGEGVGGRFVVRNGLKVGDVVVIRGNERLFPGQAVRF
ncbi:MAG: efflux RND transporter periplasmic adaptor subunit [Alphaproteobacteria bacterium]|nr:efflux RND transporter periplasmic adaptor subunit [Alphaproteobacteria bacterium]